MKFTSWLAVPVFWRKATWVPSGASGLPLVKAWAVARHASVPLKVHAEPVGSYWKADPPVPRFGPSKPGSVNPAGET